MRAQIRQYFIHSHFAHKKVHNTIRLPDHHVVYVTVKEQAASVVLKKNVDEELVYETFSSGTPENFANTTYSELRRNREAFEQSLIRNFRPQ